MIFNESVVVVEPSWVDDRGTMRPDYENPVSSTVVDLCSVQPGASSEDLQNRTQNTIRWNIFVRRIVPVSDHAAVRIGGTDYAMSGSAAYWKSPSGAVSNTALNVVDWEG